MSSDSNDDVILRTIGLGKRFGPRWAVRDLDLTVRKGQVFGFLGPNGAGKSTTIRMILSLIHPSSGRVELFGVPLQRHRRAALARVGGLVESADFYGYLSARKNLEIVASLRGGAENISEILSLVGLAERARDPVKTYSHGMKQRLGLAQALLGWPEFVVLDEPTTGLDPQGIKEVRELIGILASERRMTIFLSSHLLGEIEHTASHMVIINRGEAVVQGAVHELLASGDFHVHVLAHPPEKARAIIEAHPEVRGMKMAGAYIDVMLPQTSVPRLNADLLTGGVEVSAIVPRRSLEEYFLSITESAPDGGGSIPGGRRRLP